MAGKSKEQRIVDKLKKQEIRTPLAEEVYLPNHSGDHSRGKVYRTPTTDYEIANKAYVDTAVSGVSVEGTAVLSTGEAAGTKFLREDGDGTCSWQAVAGGGDVSKVGTPADNQVGVWTGDGTIEGTAGLTYNGTALGITGNITVSGTVDGRDVATDGTKLDGIETAADVTDATNVAAAGALMDSGTDIIDDTHINWGTGAGQVSAVDVPIADAGAIITATDVEAALQEIKTAVDLNTTHAADSSQAHSDYLINNGDDTTTGKITAANFAVTGDNSSADTPYVPMVLYNTDATPPTASTYPIGTLYVQYTA